MSVHFADRLLGAVRATQSAVMVGIDPRLEHLPPGWLEQFAPDRAGAAKAIEAFGRGVVDAVATLAPAVKFQAAYYEAYGPEGMRALFDNAAYARQRGLIVVIDGKRNDIGTTAEAYAQAYLGKVSVGGRLESVWDADAVTVNPYLGSDGVWPFIKAADAEGKGLFVLLRTSNRSAGEFQDLVAGGRPLYRHVAQRLAEWAEPYRGSSGYSLVGAVVGATYPEELAELREALPGVIFLVPGYGAQGGSGRDVAAAFDALGLGAVVNNSRGVTFAYERRELRDRFGDDWQGAIAEAVREMNDDLARHSSTARLRGQPAHEEESQRCNS
jgi:orotidine-5'-phosphate decarboxylase